MIKIHQIFMASSLSRLCVDSIDRIHSLDRDSFQQRYLAPRRPVVLTRLAEDWPARAKWTPEFFRSNYGHLMVKVFDANFASPGRGYMSSMGKMSLSEYLERVLVDDADLRMFLYNMPSEIPALKADVLLPTIADGFSSRFMFMFFGCKGSVTPLHYDIDMSHVFHTAIHGTKRFTLFAPEDSKRLYQHPFTVRSYVDVDRPDYERFPALERTKGYEVILRPGETLFIPCGYWHHVYYEEGGYAISLRCSNERMGEWLQGWFNLLLVSPIDRVMNGLLADRWFRWKAQRAQARAASFV